MNQEEHEFLCRRILVALDASQQSLTALEAAVQLAARMGAELLGLFVEDINLLRLAGLPFAHQVHYLSATGEELDRHKMERQLKAQAERARRALAAAAERTRVQWSFRVARGRVTLEVLAAASESDMLTLGKVSRPLTRQARLGSTARAVAAGAPRAVLLVEHGTSIGRRVLAVYDGSVGAKRALSAAARLAQASNGGLVVLISAESVEVAQHLEEQVAALLKGRDLHIRYRRLRSPKLPDLAHAAQAEGSALLVVDAHSRLLQGEAIHELLHAIDSPLLLIR
ncbi:MAG: universal stress protein [Acidobacteria bacterium]|nr:universal stress protein [Acidobacteriota bacterium]